MVGSGLDVATTRHIRRALGQATREGVHTFTLDTRGAVTRGDFFDCIRQSMPLNPPLVGSSVWDALFDSLLGGFDDLEKRAAVVAWVGTEDFRHNARSDYDYAVDGFSRLAVDLASPRVMAGGTFQLSFLLESSRTWSIRKK